MHQQAALPRPPPLRHLYANTPQPTPPPPWRPRGGAPGRSTHPRDAPTFAKQALTLAVGQGGASFAEGHARSPPSPTSARGKGEGIEHSRCVSRVRGSMLLPARPKSPEGTGSPPLRRPRATVNSLGVAYWVTPRGSNKPSGVVRHQYRGGGTGRKPKRQLSVVAGQTQCPGGTPKKRASTAQDR